MNGQVRNCNHPNIPYLYSYSIFEVAKVGILIQKSMSVWQKFRTFAKLSLKGNKQAWNLLAINEPKTPDCYE
ncbi:hypothetical protein JCM17136A_14060 [Phocaeicola sartorii JCM 17136 = DSM 21941]